MLDYEMAYEEDEDFDPEDLTTIEDGESMRLNKQNYSVTL